MTERRRFNRSERVALYLAADGRCARCGAELEPGWHADHERPWSCSGETDVVNGQALCPRCNLQKGNKWMESHLWQDEALRKFLASDGDFLCVACPGAGKTRFALACAKQLIDRGEIDRIIVVVPTRHLREQWSKAASKMFGIQLDPDFKHGAGTLARDFDGVVTTFAAVAAQPLLYRKLVADRRTLVILDEIHHASEEKAWGANLRVAFDHAYRRLPLSGTPFRTDGGLIPFVQPDAEGYAKAGHKYSYGEALADGIVRTVAFAAWDGEVKWRAAGAITSTGLSQTEDTARALIVAYDPDGEWIGSVLRKADAQLTQHRLAEPDAGGLVVAADIPSAKRYRTILKEISGEEPALAVSDDPDASTRITEYDRGHSRWIVAVQMISEGVDIPRLSVGVYASDFKTQLFFEQLVGRFVRLRPGQDEMCATVFIPSVEPILTYARDIEKLVPKAMRIAEDRARREAKEQQQTLEIDLVAARWEPLGSSEAIHYATFLGGDDFSDVELQRAEEHARLAGLPPNVTAAQAARFARMLGAGKVVGTAQIQPPPTRLADEKKPLRKLVNRKVNQLSLQDDRPHSHVHHELNQICHDTVPTATVETLKKRLEILDQLLDPPYA